MLNAAYPRFSLTEETITVYIRLLGDLTAEDLQMAAVQAASDNTFFPSVHELRKAVVDLKRKSGNIPSSYEAWIEVSSNTKESWSEVVDLGEGNWGIEKKTYRFSHPLVEKVAREVGWPDRFPGGVNERMADRSHFIKAYDAAVGAVVDYEMMLPEVREYISTQRFGELEAGDGKS